MLLLLSFLLCFNFFLVLVNVIMWGKSAFTKLSNTHILLLLQWLWFFFIAWERWKHLKESICEHRSFFLFFADNLMVSNVLLLQNMQTIVSASSIQMANFYAILASVDMPCIFFSNEGMVWIKWALFVRVHSLMMWF